ncbi:MAG: hypothetical protein IT271_06555 [Chitinophagales bacterium]|nr:hypothetical protein [Chitinophagales bacterium]
MPDGVIDADTIEPAGGNKCASCGSPHLTEGKTPLCSECREKFINYPIPNSIKAASFVILLIVVFSLVTFPAQLNSILLLEKAKKAIENKEYVTAEKNLEKFISKNPNHLEANSYLLITSYYNDELDKMNTAYLKIQDEKYEDEELLAKVENTIKSAGICFGSDSLHNYMEVADTLLPLKKRLTDFLSTHKDDLSAKLLMARINLSEKEYDEAEKIYDELYAVEPNSVEILDGIVSTKRMLHKYDEAMKLCEKTLSVNKQYVSVLAQKARILISVYKEKESLKLAKATVELNPKDAYAAATLAIAYHFNKMPEDRDKVLASISNDSEESAAYIQIAKDIINGKEKLR